MVKCPDCNKEITTPDKIWKYSIFTAHAYVCDCGAKFREYTKNGKHSFTLKYQKGKGYRKA